MPYSISCLADVLRKLDAEGIRGVIIGSTVYTLRLGARELEDDVDLFTTTISPVFNEDVVFEVAEGIGCQVGSTEWGTPSLECALSSECVVLVELYENIHDFYIPSEMLSEAETLEIEGFKAKVLKIEDYIILKARAGREQDMETLSYISDLIKSKVLKVDLKILSERLNLFDVDERKLIIRRLSTANIKI
ncbi:MAG: nucleotidyltransferase [Desulfurococcaceae archaeon TW002]